MTIDIPDALVDCVGSENEYQDSSQIRIMIIRNVFRNGGRQFLSMIGVELEILLRHGQFYAISC